MKIKSSLVILFFISFFLSCNSPRYSNYYSFDNQKWLQDSSIVFDFNSLTSKKLKFEISISYDKNYPYQNLYTSYSLIDSKRNVIDSQMIEFQLFEKKYGYPLGSGIFKSFIIDSTFLSVDNVIQNEDYKLLVKHSMRDKSLSGINKLGLTITD
ncbi:MAG: hypothetical protein CMG94_06410 [Marinoscillum sp.]|nr:hypothetical protein [Marinoscillum sp.]OUX26068.1 MAG: hypothetical protein CBE22_03925 [Flammeovirgaceae bacterium TMED262]|tara:strand:+ start:8475 stop:8936 length:462 start_codon:yes stop_codon:yes gene_type:complete